MAKVYINIFRPIILVTVLCVVFVYGISFLQNNTFVVFLLYCVLSVCTMGAIIFCVGMNIDEKKYLVGMIHLKILRK